MVVEEVGAPIEEIKEKVEELKTLTENISESAEKSTEVQEEIATAVEGVMPKDESNEAPVIDNSQPAMPEMPLPQIKSNRGPNPLMIIIPGIFLLGALLGGIAFYQKSVSGITAEPTGTPASYNNLVDTPTSPPSPSTTKLDLTKYPVNVMNGSGIVGQAGVVKTLLTTAGFSVSATGNASSYDFTKTVIKAKATVPAEFLTQLSTALSKSYVLDANVTLATSSADQVQVIIGSTKAK